MVAVRVFVLSAVLSALGGEALRHKPASQNSSSVKSLVKLDHRLGMRVRQGIEQLEAWKDSGKAVATKLTEQELKTTVGSITGASYGQEQSSFVNGVASRFVSNPGNAEMAGKIQQELGALGYKVREQKITQHISYGTPTRGNIIGYLKGSDLSGEVVVFGAHYDSVNWKVAGGAAPGADDNGSGVAALLQIARTIAQESRRKPLRRSVLLVAFQAEEVGLYGSKAFVRDVLKKGDYGRPVAAVIADEVSFPGRAQFSHRAIFETKGRSPANVAMIDTMAHQAQADASIAGFEVNYAGFGSDHIPFLEAGYPAVLLIERDNMYFADHWGHTSGDDLKKTDPNFGASMTRLAARTVLAYASPE